MRVEIENLLLKGAVHGGPNPGHILPYLFGPQTRRRLAPSYKPQAFEQFSENRAFQDGESDALRGLLQKGDLMVKVDLKDAYLMVPIHHQDRKFLRFSWEQEVFQFCSLPFGLASAPRTFTKLLRPLLALLRSQGLRMVVYLDNVLLMASSEELIGQHLTLLVSWLEELGFIINKDNSVMEPGHQIEFLGLTVNSNTMSLSVPQDKIAKVQKECRHMLNRGVASAQELSHLIGLLSSLIWAVLPAPLHYRALQRLKHRALTSLGSWDLQVSLDSSSQRNLVFWVSQLKEHNGRSLEFSVATMIISSDACWGAYSSISSVGGHWSPAEPDLHINALELKAAFLALESLASHLRDCHILLLLDNITAISFINHKGGTRSHTLSDLALDMWTWCLQRGITVHAEHLPGSCNIETDRISRRLFDSSNWRLDHSVFQKLVSLWGPFDIDLFAARHNSQLPQYFSYMLNPEALAMDALAQSWEGLSLYAFPPFSLIGRILQKMRQEQVKELVLIAPAWQSQVWYPQLLSQLVDFPHLLPLSHSLLLNPLGQPHPLVLEGTLLLAAWRVSGIQSNPETFQRRLSNSSPWPGGGAQKSLTTQPGPNGVAGVLRERLIPFYLL